MKLANTVQFKLILLRKQQSYMLYLLFLSLVLLVTPCFAADCIWDPSMWKENCFQYCFHKYGRAPQRGYYNQTSQNCQPLRKCGYRFPPQKPYYYKYDQNRCYESKTNLTEVSSFRPLALKTTQVIPVAGQNMICMHGRKVKVYYTTVGSHFICQCESLWQDSGKFDMNGVPFKCDTPITDVVGYFVGSIEYDSQGNRVKFGKYTPQQISIALQNLRQIQKQETKMYVLRHQQSIFYAINKAFKNDSDQTFYSITIPNELVISVCALFYVIILISYIEERFSIIYITKQQLIQKINEAIEQESLALKLRD